MDYPKGLENGKEPQCRQEKSRQLLPRCIYRKYAQFAGFCERREQSSANRLDDALRTMEVVEAAYESNDHGGVGYVRMSVKNRNQNSSFKENCICR
jgi:histidinol-phosphate/aromatic aminotransferase/cobyric acid decarboxylase-like protein